jgi:uncharacterized protein YjaZ
MKLKRKKGYDPSKRKISRSTTFWFSLIAIVLNPIAWIMDYSFKMKILEIILENKDKITATEASPYMVNIPLATIATLAVMVVSFYTVKRGADKITSNITSANETDTATIEQEVVSENLDK